MLSPVSIDREWSVKTSLGPCVLSPVSIGREWSVKTSLDPRVVTSVYWS